MAAKSKTGFNFHRYGSSIQVLYFQISDFHRYGSSIQVLYFQISGVYGYEGPETDVQIGRDGVLGA